MNNNELYHWKYVSKKKVNGKWRYTYPDGSSSSKIGDRIKDALGVDEKTKYKEAAVNKAEADKAADKSREGLSRRKEIYEKNPKDSLKKNYDTALAKQKADWENSVEAGKKAIEAKLELYSTPIGKLYRANDVAKAKVDQTLKNVEKKVDETVDKIEKKAERLAREPFMNSLRKEARASEAEQRETEAKEEAAAKKRREDDARKKQEEESRKQQIERDFKESLRTSARASEAEQREEERKEEVRRKYINPYIRKRKSQNSFNRK